MSRNLSVLVVSLLVPASLSAAEDVRPPGYGEVVQTEAWTIQQEPGPPAAGEEVAAEPAEAPAAPVIEIEIPLPEHREGPPLPLEQIRAVTYDRSTGTVRVHEPHRPVELPKSMPGAPGVGPAGPGLRSRAEELVSIFAPDFSGLSRITNTTDYPWAANVRLRVCFPYQGTTVCGGCSGSLVDSMHVLTAGHCVYAHTIGSYTINNWASSIEVAPGYDSGTRPFGTADFTQLHSYNGWTSSEDFDYDIGFIDLDRPVGSLSGWLGYGYHDSCSFFTGNTFDNPGYPGDPPYTGNLMYNWSGTFDGCEALFDIWYGNEIEIESYCYGGQSGSNGFRTRSSPIARSVLSNGNASSCFHVRLTSGFYSDIGGWIGADTPSTQDLIPLRVLASPTSMTAGSQLSQLSYVIHNYSTSTWAATFTAKVYLSTNNIITTSDRLIQTHGVSVQIGPKGSVVVNVSPPPTIPADVTSGNFWLGVILEVNDANNTNNATGTQDAFGITVQALPTVTITATDATATEAGPTSGTFRVSRTGSTSSSLTVNLSVGGSATSGSDYLALPGSVTIPAGSSFTDFNVNPINDTLVESDETVIINLSPGSYNIGSPSSTTITITSDDTGLPTVTITAPDASATEAGPTTGTFRVSRTGSTNSSLTVNLSIGGSATSGSDYLALPGSVTIPAGSSFTDFNVNPINDTLVESDETVIVNLSPGSYNIGSPSSTTITITSDDAGLPTVTITATDATATEAGPTSGTFRVSRSGGTSSSLVVNLSAGGSATSGSDYLALPGSVTVPAGSSSADVTVNPINDPIAEPDETVALSLVSGSGYVIGSPASATVVLISDDSGGGSPVLFQDNMEGGEERWSPQAPWARTTASSHSPSRSWTDSPGSNYGNGINLSLFTQPIDLSGASSALLTFWHRYDTESEFDFAQVWATSDSGSNWTWLRSFTGSNLVWSPVTIDLGAFAGQPPVMLAFQMLSDGSVTRDGWYVDDVTVQVRPVNDFYTIVPCRVINTQSLGRLTSGVPFVINVAQVCGIPSTARAVSVNVTVVSPTGTGRVTLYPSDESLPGTSTVSFGAGQTRASLAILRISVDGKLTVYPFLTGGGQLDLILDVTGYFQ